MVDCMSQGREEAQAGERSIPLIRMGVRAAAERKLSSKHTIFSNVVSPLVMDPRQPEVPVTTKQKLT